MQGGVFASSASAATYTTGRNGDDFIAGDFKSNEPVNLTVTKYTTFNPGNPNATGSENDKPTSGVTPEKNVTFSLTRIEANDGFSPSDFTNDNGNVSNPAPTHPAWHADTGTGNVFYGRTNDDGIINQWYNGIDSQNIPTGTAVTSLPQHHWYYVLHQVNNPNSHYQVAQDSVFDLPYRATNGTGDSAQDGFVYNLHVYPKNVSSSHVQKNVVSINKKESSALVVKAGDEVKYDLIFKFDGFTRGNDTNPDHIYLDDLVNAPSTDTYPWVRLVDRYSDKLMTPVNSITNKKLVPDSVGIGYRDANGNTQSIPLTAALYTATVVGPEHSPYTLDKNGHDTTTEIFGGSTSDAQGVNYLIWDLNHQQFANFNLKDPKLANASEPEFEAQVTFKLKSDDQESNIPGSLVNDFGDSFRGHKTEIVRNHIPSAGFDFAKVDTDNNGIDGAVFRLVKHGDKTATHFLASNGHYYTDAGVDSQNSTEHPLPTMSQAGAIFIEATSNNNGIVTFQNLPIFTREANGNANWIPSTDAVWDVIEYRSPTYTDSDGTVHSYKRATMPFGTISYQHQIETWNNHKNASGAADPINPGDLPEGTHITPDQLTGSDGHIIPSPYFGKWAAKNLSITTPTNYDNEKTTITNGLVNYKPGQPTPINLPLTGGMGIVLLLVIGAVIMAIVIIERKRREANARR